MQILAPVEVKDVDDDDDGEEASSSEKTLCPLCQAQIGTDESDITQHLFDAHGIDSLRINNTIGCFVKQSF